MSKLTVLFEAERSELREKDGPMKVFAVQPQMVVFFSKNILKYKVHMNSN